MPTTNKPAGIEFYGGYQVYSESGVDLTLLRENLRRTVEQRWENSRRAAALGEALARSRSVHPNSQPPTEEGSFVLDPAAILRRLIDHQVQFVVIGGLAMTLPCPRNMICSAFGCASCRLTG